MLRINLCLFFFFFSLAISHASEIMHHWSSRTNINTSIVRQDSRGELATLWRSPTSRASVYMCVTLSTPLSLIVIQSSCLPRHRNDNEVFCLTIDTHTHTLSQRSIILTIDRTSGFALKMCGHDRTNCNYSWSNGFSSFSDLHRSRRQKSINNPAMFPFRFFLLFFLGTARVPEFQRINEEWSSKKSETKRKRRSIKLMHTPIER